MSERIVMIVAISIVFLRIVSGSIFNLRSFADLKAKEPKIITEPPMIELLSLVKPPIKDIIPRVRARLGQKLFILFMAKYTPKTLKMSIGNTGTY